jgi:tetratricopeptide (TPR) repeat protein
MAGLWLTGSRGGWLAAAGGLLALGALHLWARSPRWRAGVMAAAAVAVLGGGIAAGTGGVTPATLRASSKSAAVRLDYWSAGLKVVDTAPLLGVGLDNFGDHYLRHKRAGAQETRRAHNDYLDAWAETGFVGFAVFVSIWAVFLGRVLSGLAKKTAMDSTIQTFNHSTNDGALDLGLRVSVVLGGGAAFGLAALRVMLFRDDAATAAVGLFCLAAWIAWVWRGASLAVDPGRAGPALAAGVCGFLLHAAIDFDWSVGAIQWGVLALAAAWACAAGRRKDAGAQPAVDVPVGAFGGVMAAAPMLTATLVMAGFLVPRATRADEATYGALESFRFAEALHAEARGRGREAPDGATAARMLQAFRAGERLAHEALAANPWDVRPVWLLAQAFASPAAAALDRALPDAPSGEADARLEGITALLGRAIELDPHAAGLRAVRGDLWERQAERFGARLADERADRSRLELRIKDAWDKARQAYAEAVERYPTNAWYRYRYGRALERAGSPESAKREYAQALACHRAQDLKRLKLPEDVVREIEGALKN